MHLQSCSSRPRPAEWVKEGESLVQEVRNRSWVGRFLKASPDKAGLQEIAAKIMEALSLLTADVGVSVAQDMRELRTLLETGQFFSARQAHESLVAAAGVKDGAALTLEDAQRVAGDKDLLAVVFQDLSPGEQLLLGAMGTMEMRLRDVMQSHPTVEALPGPLRELWKGERGMGLGDDSVSWELFMMFLLPAAGVGGLECLEGLEQWYAEGPGDTQVFRGLHAGAPGAGWNSEGGQSAGAGQVGAKGAEAG